MMNNIEPAELGSPSAPLIAPAFRRRQLMLSHTCKRKSLGRRAGFWAIVFLIGSSVLAMPGPLQAQGQWTTTGNNISNTNSGNVGVGTSSPYSLVELAKPGAVTTTNTYDSTNPLITVRNTSATNNNYSGIGFANSAASGFVTSAIFGVNESHTTTPSGHLEFFTKNAGSFLEAMRITAGGNVGIGTATPGALLEVKKAQNAGTTLIMDNSYVSAGNAAYSGLFLKQAGVNRLFLGAINDGNTAQFGGPAAVLLWNYANGPILFSTNNLERMRIVASGNVGIGTTTPLQRLQVGSNTASSTVTPDSISLGGTYSSVAGANPKLRLFDDNSGSVYGIGVSSAQLDFMAPVSARYVWNINGVEKMRLDNAGNITVAGNIAAKYQDVAEWVESSQELPAGTVVVLDSTKSNQVIASTTAYDSRIAGVISLQPGIALGERGEGRLLVAATGRVKVKVDATNGPIQIGDLLVTSDREGFAMKSVPVDVGGIRIHRPGTLIGKALEPLEKGQGEILVLLSLQ
jgi:hypothetical protein